MKRLVYKNPVCGAILIWQYKHLGNKRDLAQLLGVSSQTIRIWENKGCVPVRHQKKFLEVTGVDLRE
jgi:phage terminase Nu1 subunit (DNA packaging protein)